MNKDVPSADTMHMECHTMSQATKKQMLLERPVMQTIPNLIWQTFIDQHCLQIANCVRMRGGESQQVLNTSALKSTKVNMLKM